MDAEITAFLLRTSIVGALLIGFLYWKFKDALLTKIMVSITPFLVVMSTSAYLNAKLGTSVPWLGIAGPVTVISVGILSILFVNNYSRLRLNALLRQVHTVSNDLSGTSGAISEKSEVLMMGANQQEDAVFKTEQSLQKGLKAAESTLAVSKEAVQQTREARKSFEAGSTIMKEVSEAITKIRDNATRSGSIVKTIEGIALQTNILSLNAAVEAQRAGSAGQGFAVVADEVRTLAGKVTLSTKDINNLMDETKKYSDESGRLAGNLAQVIRQFDNHVNAFNETVQTMAEHAREQQEVMKEIRSGIEHLLAIAKTLQNAGDSSSADASRLEQGIQQLEKAEAGLHALVNGSKSNYLDAL